MKLATCTHTICRTTAPCRYPESLFTVTVGYRTHRALQEWINPGQDGAYMVFTACGSTLYPRTDRETLKTGIGNVDCPNCLTVS